MPDPIRIRSGSAGKHCMAGSRPDDSGTPACFRNGSVWTQPDMAIQSQSGPIPAVRWP